MYIVLASVLKPKEDVRLYHKIAQSITAQMPDAKVEVWGQGNLYHFKRLGWARCWANWTFFLALWRAKPTTVIVATFELLPAGVCYKWLFGGKLGYDVQENYAFNVRYTRVFPAWLRGILAFFIRLIERCALPFVDFVWVAEACYLTEMPFLRRKAVFLPNKASENSLSPYLSPTLPTHAGKVCITYTGNVSEDYGVFQAIAWIKKWHEALPALTLNVVGHCPSETDQNRLMDITKTDSFISLHIQGEYLPHQAILEAIQKADWLLMPYILNKSVQARIPTKFYEALALGKRMLITQNKAWEDFMQDFPEAVVVWISPEKSEDELLKEIQAKQNILPARYTENVFWEFEATKCL